MIPPHLQSRFTSGQLRKVEDNGLRAAVLAASLTDEKSPVTLPNGDVVPFGQIIALTNGEALRWIRL